MDQHLPISSTLWPLQPPLSAYVQLAPIPHRSKIIQYLFFCVCLVSLSLVSSGFIHVVANNRFSYFLRSLIVYHLYILHYLFPGPNCPMLFIRADPLSFQVEMIEIGLLGSIWHSWGSGSLPTLSFPLWGLSWHWAGPLWEKGKVWLFSASVVRLFAPLGGWVLSSGLPNSHKGTVIQGWLSKWCFFGKRSVQTYSAILQTSLLCPFFMVCLDFPLLPIQQSMNLLHSHLSSLTLFLLSLIFTSIIFKKL